MLLILLMPGILAAGQISTVCHNELSSWIATEQPVSIVDIQTAEGFRAHNYSHSLATGNISTRLKKIAAQLRSTTGKVVIVSATGGSDALRAKDLLVRGGVQRSRILLLEGGMETAAKNAACDCCLPVSGKDLPK